MGILDQIANPIIADPRASFEQGRQIGRQKMTKDLSGQILAETLGSKVGMQAYKDLQELNPEAALNMRSALNSERDSDAQYMLGLAKVGAEIISGGGTADDVIKYLAPQVMLTQKSGSMNLSQQLADTITELRNPETQESTMREIMAAAAGFSDTKDADKFSAKTEILEDGSTIQTTTSGKRIVKNPEGTVVTGAEAAKIVKAAKEEGIRIQSERAGGRSTAKAAVKRSEKAFDSVEKIKSNMLNLDEGIKLIDEGAETGPVMALLPSVRSTAVQLDNLQGRLGLDVIGNTTFGALSESELKFALNTAFPKNLKPEDLRAWLVRKKEAQTKLASYLTEVAQFLGTPGNTTADFIELQKVRQLEAEQLTQTSSIEPVDLTTLSMEELQELRKGAQ